MADSIAPDVRFATGILENYNVNTVRLESNGSTTAQAGQIVTFNLPSATTVDLQSFAVHMNVKTTKTGADNSAIYAKLPADTSSLVSQIQVFIAGVQISSIQDFATISRIKKLVNSSRDRSQSVDNVLYHGNLDSTLKSVEDVDVLLKPRIGIFAESSTRVLPLAVLGDVTIRITFASNAVLTYTKGNTGVIGGPFASGDSALAATLKYSVESLHATVNTLSMGPMYEQMIVERLASGQPLSMHIKEYYPFNLSSQTGSSCEVRFSLSSSSMDRLYAVCRYSNYLTNGVPGRSFAKSEGGNEAAVANYFLFSSFNGPRNMVSPAAGASQDTTYAIDPARKKNGSVQYQYSINAVQHPQYTAQLLDAAHECLLISDQGGLGGRGWQATSFDDFQDSKCVFPLQLAPPGTPIAIKGGYSSRGNNSHMVFSVKGQEPDSEKGASTSTNYQEIPQSISTTVFVEATTELKILGAKEISVVY